MRDSPAQIFRQYLIDQGVAVGNAPTGTAWGIVSGPLPLYSSEGSGGGRFISVQDTGFVYEGKVQQTGERSVRPTLQIMVRAPADYNVGWEKCQEIEAKADMIGVTPGLANAPLVQVDGTGGNSYRITTAHIFVATTPIGIEEQSNRQLFTINLQLIPVEV